ncbi:23S rRNA (guanosine2251-2'-O)-methyltransferase [Filimonas lacunae]|uniref:23S rRNA (Guanosine2251-2'-O)-methyltransferase n=1 Tax=Filimonas lacunae TaxID=477680 RepID=A0A173MLC7_9BACT|nr:23S rRNA (guanosine(2251)-2'-O)-methyltransferase RlmB [Filimonas lacunae]BAV08211.1 23S rRNA (guanosine-2'-O-) -methyltransferase RlmB [Filimonas lacunae]SIT33045.1 23S rRNA (guanosine2251-2'-O)-methyltransferase [Filimonas lacunae]
MFQSKKNIIAGRNPVTEALKAGQTIDKVLMFKNASGEAINEIRQLAKDNNVPVQYVPNEKLNSLTNVQHQGVVAFKSAIRYQDLQQVIDWVNEKGEVPLFLILDGVTDVRNIGAIARTALCCGAQAIIIPDKGVGALNEDAVKTSAGALELIQICRVNSLMKAVDELHLNGIKVFASEMTAKKRLFDLELKEPAAIVMGGEEKGVFPALMRICDEQFHIPMSNGFESLNVSVATGMILYEVMKQRITG